MVTGSQLVGSPTQHGTETVCDVWMPTGRSTRMGRTMTMMSGGRCMPMDEMVWRLRLYPRRWMRWPGVRPTRSLSGSTRPELAVFAGLTETSIKANPGCLFREPPEFLEGALLSGGGIGSQLSQCLFKHFWWLATRDQVPVIENDGGHGVNAEAGVEGFCLAHLGGKGITRQYRLGACRVKPNLGGLLQQHGM